LFSLLDAPFAFGAKSQQRLIVSTKLLWFYDTVSRAVTAGNLQWTPVMKNFSEQWKALEDKKGGDEPDVPMISKALPIVIKWTEAFRDYLHRVIGVRTIPLASFRTKKGNGSSAGVPLRYHKKEEYDLLNKAQRAELREWRLNRSTKGGEKKGSDRKFDTAKAIASAVEKKVNERMKYIEQEKSTNAETDAYIASVMDKRLAKTAGKIVQISDTTSTPTPAAAAPTLKSIIKRAKNSTAGT
jgi:hypothetical protein